jgi:hypothetical protein
VGGVGFALTLLVMLVVKGPVFVLGVLKTAGIGLVAIVVVFLILISFGGGC